MASHTHPISTSLHNLNHFTKAEWEKLSLHPREPKHVQTEQFLVFLAGMGKDPVLPYVKVPVPHGGFITRFQGLSVSPLWFPSDRRGKKSSQVLFAQEGIQRQLSELISWVCNCRNRRAHVCCSGLVMLFFNSCQFSCSRCVHEGLKTPQQGEPEALLLLIHLPFFRAFHFTTHIFFTQVWKK